MSGHSKWSSIKHKKGAADAKRGKLFSKLSRAIIVAAREGGSDPAGNLALQNAIEVRRPEELEGLDGLVIPGGESTTMMRLARIYGLDEAIRRFRGAVLGTCAGMIVLDREHLGLADLAVDRNAYGRQVQSFEAEVELAGDDEAIRGVFIRAPRIRQLQAMREDELYAAAKEHRAPHELVRWVAENGRLPVVTFTAGGIATPADASLCMQLGADGVFVGSGIFKSGRDPLDDPDGWRDDVARRARAIVEATTHFDDPKVLADVSAGLGQPMVGISATSLPEAERLEVRGW